MLFMFINMLEAILAVRPNGLASEYKFFSEGRVGLAQLVRFLVVKLIHPCLNPRFDIGVAFMANYSFSGRRHPHRQ
jgi:hypothetical protein